MTTTVLRYCSMIAAHLPYGLLLAHLLLETHSMLSRVMFRERKWVRTDVRYADSYCFESGSTSERIAPQHQLLPLASGPKSKTVILNVTFVSQYSQALPNSC